MDKIIIVSEDQNTISVDGIDHEFVSTRVYKECIQCSLRNYSSCHKIPCNPRSPFVPRLDRKVGHYKIKQRPRLVLTLTKFWWDEIYFHYKREEYRDIKPSYNRIFIDGKVKIKGKLYDPKDIDLFLARAFDKDRAVMKCELTDLRIDEGLEEWGAKPGVKYHVLAFKII